MKPLYLLTHIWSEFETHYEEFDIEEIKLNRFIWEK